MRGRELEGGPHPHLPEDEGGGQTTNQRQPQAPVLEGCGYSKCSPTVLSPFSALWSNQAAKGMAKYRPSWCLSLALFYKWLGLWILMTRCELPNRERYWEEGDGRFDPDFHFRDIMSFHLFQEILGVLTLPQDSEYPKDMFAPVRMWMNACCLTWQGAG